MSPLKLTIELVPKPTWNINLRSLVSSRKWDEIRRYSYKRAGNRCEICGGRGHKHPVECHEEWDYSTPGIQKLSKVTALCPDCHLVKHIGRAQATGQYGKALVHFMKINQVSRKDADIYIRNCFDIWEERSKHSWSVDISNLEEVLK